MSAPRSEDQIEEIVALDLSQPTSISVENQDGDITVRGTDRSDVLIRAQKHGKRASAVYQAASLLIETGAAQILIKPVLPPQSGSGPFVSVDLGLDLPDFGPDFIRDILGSNRTDEGRDQHWRQRRERRGRGFALIWNNSEVSYEIEIEVPRGHPCLLGLNTASGDVRVDDLTGELTVNTASGDSTLSRIIGEITVNTASGDLTINRAVGRITGRSASGDVRIEASALSSLGFQTASGDLQLDAALTGEGPYRIKTASGDSNLAVIGLDPGTGTERSLEVTYQTMSGDARLDGEFRPQGPGRWTTEGATPGRTMGVSTMSGDLRGKVGVSAEARAIALTATSPVAATRREPVAVLPPMPPAPEPPPSPVPPAMPAAADIDARELDAVHTGGLDTPGRAATADADRLALLEAVQRGEIDIDEALQRLEDRSDAGSNSDQ